MVRGNAPTGWLWRTCRLRQDGPLPAPFGLVSRTQIKRLRHIQQIAIAPLSPAPPNLARLGGKPKFRLSVGRSVAQPGSALASGARGRRFESSRSDQSFPGMPDKSRSNRDIPNTSSRAISSRDCERPPPARDSIQANGGLTKWHRHAEYRERCTASFPEAASAGRPTWLSQSGTGRRRGVARPY